MPNDARRLPRNEVGFALCRMPTGKLATGPVSSGTPTRVDIAASCPPGGTLVGLFHTHPGGIAYPSAMDVRAAKKVRAPNLCILSDSQLGCYKVGRATRE